MNVYKIGRAIIQTNDDGVVVAVNKHGLRYFYEDITDVIRAAEPRTIKRIEHTHEQFPVSDLPPQGREVRQGIRTTRGFANYTGSSVLHSNLNRSQ